MCLKVKKISEDVKDFVFLENGDWIDMFVNSACVCENREKTIRYNMMQKTNDFTDKISTLSYDAGDVVIVRFGVAMKMPYFYEGEIRARSSTFMNTGLILTNGVGTIDESYCGDNDEWIGVFYATRKGSISKNDRLTQFKTYPKTVKPEIKYVESLDSVDRGGYGSSGK
jgi:dUTP pyrophosphatase